MDVSRNCNKTRKCIVVCRGGAPAVVRCDAPAVVRGDAPAAATMKGATATASATTMAAIITVR